MSFSSTLSNLQKDIFLWLGGKLADVLPNGKRLLPPWTPVRGVLAKKLMVTLLVSSSKLL